MVITTREFANLYKPSLVNQVYTLMFATGKDEPLKVRDVASKEMRKANITFEIIDDLEGILSIMCVVNKMVKDESFPFSRNNFYEKKTKLIKRILKTNPDMVSEIRESDNLYNFIIGGYSFHQPKSRYPNNKFDTIPEEYVPHNVTVEYNHDTYVKCIISMAYYLTKHFC